MTSESDSKPRRRPPTIDLTATEVQTEIPGAQSGGPTEGENSGARQAGPESRRGGNFAGVLRPLALGAVAGAVLVVALAFGLWAADVIPARNAPAVRSAGATAAVSSQLAKIEAALQSRTDDAQLASRVTAVEAQMKALGDSLAAINRRLDDIAVTAQSARQGAAAAADAAKAATQTASAAADAAKTATQNADAASAAAKGVAQNAAQTSVQRSDLDALAGRIAALERSIKALDDSTARRASGADDRAARAAVAAEALRATVERGAPYQAELASVRSFGVDQADVSALEPFAASGVPAAAELSRALSQLIPALAKASNPRISDGTFLGRLEDHAKNLVRVTPVDAPMGDDPSAIVGRLSLDAARGDVAAALVDIDRLPGTAKPVAASWAEKARARDAAVAASRRIAAAALAGLSSANTQ